MQWYTNANIYTLSYLVCLYSVVKSRISILTLFILSCICFQQVRATTLPSFIYKNPNVTPATKSFWENVNIELDHVIISLQVVVILLLIAHFVIVNTSRNKKTQIICEISNGKTCVLISLKQLSLCPTYWRVKIPESITNITIQGLLVPWLSFTWDDLKVTNTLTDETIVVRPLFKVNSFQAIRLKKIMNTPYCVYFFIQHNNLLIPLK